MIDKMKNDSLQTSEAGNVLSGAMSSFNDFSSGNEQSNNEDAFTTSTTQNQEAPSPCEKKMDRDYKKTCQEVRKEQGFAGNEESPGYFTSRCVRNI